MEPQLSSTAKVILGMVAIGKQTGYEIKQFVDKTTRHFWAASYGRIYPELRRLEEQGLVQTTEEPSGGRARTIVSLTPAGRAAFERWRAAEDEGLNELRDEGMLRLFFSGDDPELVRAQLERMRESHVRVVDQLREIGPHASQAPMGTRLTWKLGTGMNEWCVQWCDEALAELDSERQ